MKLNSKILFQPIFLKNINNVYSIDNFNTLYDENFIDAAYQAILNRTADEIGKRYYLSRLRAGTSKCTILNDLLRSDEAKKLDVKIVGLQRAIHIEKIYSIPFLGSILLAIFFLSNLKRHLTNLRALENHTIRLAEEVHKSISTQIDNSSK